MVASFVCLYRGESVSEAKLVAVSSDPGLIRDVAGRLLGEASDQFASPDPVIISITEGKKRALRHILREAE